MTEIYSTKEMDEEDKERQRFEKLNTSMQKYIDDMHKARDELRTFHETVLMKPFYINIVQNSPNGSSVAGRFISRRRHKTTLCNVPKLLDPPQEPKKAQDRSFLIRRPRAVSRDRVGKTGYYLFG